MRIIDNLPGREVKLRVSLYEDDTVIFANPIKEEINNLLQILELFGNATGLRVNVCKSHAVPIRCDGIDLAQVLQNFGGQTACFPITYLDLPISIARARLVQMQFILDRIRARLAGWKGKLMSMAARRVLVRCVLSAIPTFAPTALRAPKRLLLDIDKVR